jgi:hypothetical protein
MEVVMQTRRDAEIVDWIGRIGAASAQHVMGRFDMGRSVAYERLNSLSSDGLIDHQTVLFGRPGMYSATSAGLRWQGLDRLNVFKVRPGSFEHTWQVTSTAVELYRGLPDWDVLSEREIRSIEADSNELFASIQVGKANGHPLLHRPDLVLASPSTRIVPVEVELSIKSASRLTAICQGWARARHVNCVYYLSEPGPARAVSRAVRSVTAGDRVTVLALNDVALLTTSEYAREEAANALL